MRRSLFVLVGPAVTVGAAALVFGVGQAQAASPVARVGPSAAAARSDPAGAFRTFRAHPAAVTPRPGRPAATTVRTPTSGEALLDLTAAAPVVSWASTVHTSTVLSVDVDGRYALDLVVPSASPIPREVALGRLAAGTHRITLTVATDRSPAGGTKVRLTDLRVRVAADGSGEAVALAHAPVLYGRDTPAAGNGAGGPFQNATTDTPLIAYHTDVAATTPGLRVLEYSIVWSNEDGGTSTPALMARWGRTTDIEWIYRVEVDAAGNAVPGTAVYQGAAHATSVFAGRYEGAHPLLQTCTANNNVCDTVTDPMRFAPSTAEQLDPTTTAREQMMDAHPWTYQVMAAEVRREGRVVASPPAFTTTLIADPRDYLYLVVRKHTNGVQTDAAWVGTTIAVKVKGQPWLYRSDQLFPSWSLERDDPAATTVELPPGTTPADITEIDALRVPGTLLADPGSTVTIQGINRAFFLGRNDRPRASFLSTPLNATLTQASPVAVLWKAPA